MSNFYENILQVLLASEFISILTSNTWSKAGEGDGFKTELRQLLYLSYKELNTRGKYPRWIFNNKDKNILWKDIIFKVCKFIILNFYFNR